MIDQAWTSLFSQNEKTPLPAAMVEAGYRLEEEWDQNPSCGCCSLVYIATRLRTPEGLLLDLYEGEWEEV